MNRQTIIVHHSLTGAIQSFNKNLFLDFTPSSVIIRGVDYGEGAGATDLHGIIAPWSDNPIATFIDDTNNGYTSNPGTTFKINNPGVFSNGQITFQVRRLNNATSASTATGKISLTLEFIMEKTITPKINVDMKPLMDLISARIPVNAFSRELSFGRGEDEEEQDQKQGQDELIVMDTRNTEDQVNPIPNVHSTLENETITPDDIVKGEEIKQEGGMDEIDESNILPDVPTTRFFTNRTGPITRAERKAEDATRRVMDSKNMRDTIETFAPVVQLVRQQAEREAQMNELNREIEELEDELRRNRNRLLNEGRRREVDIMQTRLNRLIRQRMDAQNPNPIQPRRLFFGNGAKEAKQAGLGDCCQDGGVFAPRACQRARELRRKKGLHRRKRSGITIKKLSIEEEKELSKSNKECREIKRKLPGLGRTTFF